MWPKTIARADLGPATASWEWPLPACLTREDASCLIRRGPQPGRCRAPSPGFSHDTAPAAPPARASLGPHLLERLGRRFFAGFPRVGPARRNRSRTPGHADERWSALRQRPPAAWACQEAARSHGRLVWPSIPDRLNSNTVRGFPEGGLCNPRSRRPATSTP